jgi:dihydrofolate synthase / folylpolyglutamate synthase
MQRLADGPLTQMLPQNTEIWLDGGHNVDAGLALARHFTGDGRRIHLVTGMLANKDPNAIIAALRDKLDSITVLPVPGHEHHGADAFGPMARGASDIHNALKMLVVNPERDILLIAGSLYLAGTVLSANNEAPT